MDDGPEWPIEHDVQQLPNDGPMQLMDDPGQLMDDGSAQLTADPEKKERNENSSVTLGSNQMVLLVSVSYVAAFGNLYSHYEENLLITCQFTIGSCESISTVAFLVVFITDRTIHTRIKGAKSYRYF